MGLGGTLFGLMMWSDRDKERMDRLRPYNPNSPVFSKVYEEQHPTRRKQMLNALKRKGIQKNASLYSKENLRKTAMVLPKLLNGVHSGNMPGLNKLAAFPNGFGDIYNWLKTQNVGSALIAAGSLGLGASLMAAINHKTFNTMDELEYASDRKRAYRKYLAETGISDTPEEKKLFYAAFMLNPKYMQNPLLANSIMKQIKDYGGLDINMISNLAKINEGTKPAPLSDIAAKSTIGYLNPYVSDLAKGSYSVPSTNIAGGTK